MPDYLSFGIRPLDCLIDRRRDQGGLEINAEENTTVAIIGPDGTGKSILALHLASSYGTAVGGMPRVMYVSTDLSHSRANTTWKKFGLETPQARKKSGPPWVVPTLIPTIDKISLEQYLPLAGNLVDYLMGKNPPDQVAFLDLERQSMGDDWLYLHRLLAALPECDSSSHRHLMIVDAVEGLETFAGHRDSFGEVRDRRSRIAQLIRLAKNKCHLVLVVEEPKVGERLPEEFVADLVLRLRVRTEHGYSNRTIEIEKARGQHHIRGQHDFSIRQQNDKADSPPDNPECDFAYFDIHWSIHARSRIRTDHENPPAIRPPQSSEDNHGAQGTPVKNRYCGFGIPYLDRLVGKHDRDADTHGDAIGIPAGSVATVIGDDGTHKSRVGRAFLSRAFKDGARHHDGVAVLFTTQTLDRVELWRKLDAHRELKGQPKLTVDQRNRVFCRSLPIHHMPATILMHIVEHMIEKAVGCLYGWDEKTFEEKKWDNPTERRKETWRIRVVIDDWSTIQSTNPEAVRDPLLLPYLLDYLRREGVTTLVIDTQPGSPKHALETGVDRKLRSLSQHHLYTWHVPFYGERRVAITAVPPVSDDLPVVVYELRPARSSVSGKKDETRLHEECLTVDPHFEMYSGLEEGHPARVPLKVRLYVGDRDPEAESAAPPKLTYFERTKDLFARLFEQVGTGAIEFEDAAGYEQLRDYSNLQDGSKLDYTLVFQVDEFWAESRGELHRLEEYLLADTLPDISASHADKKAAEEQVEIEDPFRTFDDPISARVNKRLPARTADKRHRIRVFRAPGYELLNSKSLPKIDKTPFLWDFGFLLVRAEVWQRMGDKKLPLDMPNLERLSLKPGERWTVRNVFESLRIPRGGENLKQRLIAWPLFFATCDLLRSRSDDRVFDIDVRTPEAMSCLVLEVWFSFIYERTENDYETDRRAEREKMRTIAADHLAHRRYQEAYRWNQMADKHQIGAHNTGFLKELVANRYSTTLGPQTAEPLYSPGLRTMVADPDHRTDLYRTLWLLRHYCDHLRVETGCFVPEVANPNAIAARHWYSTASDQRYRQGDLIPIRLPGYFSTRGDWFLAMTRGSRSPRLGMRAMDVLCSQRANHTRLAEGLGLPTREASDGKDDDLLTYLRHSKDHGQAPRVTYGELKQLGRSENRFQGCSRFSWIWRSTIKHYERHNRLFNHWLAYCFRDVESFFPRVADAEIAFRVSDTNKDQYRETDQYRAFDKACNVLVSLLKAAESDDD